MRDAAAAADRHGADRPGRDDQRRGRQLLEWEPVRFGFEAR